MISPAVILTARVFGLPPEAVGAGSHKAPVVRARAALASALRLCTDPATGAPMGYAAAARLAGLRDHSTVHYLSNVVAVKAERADAEWAARRDELRGLLAEWLAGRDLPALAPEPRHPAVLLNPVKPKNEPAANDRDALERFRGTTALLAAIRREHPERVLVGDRSNARSAVMPPVLGEAA